MLLVVLVSLWAVLFSSVASSVNILVLSGLLSAMRDIGFRTFSESAVADLGGFFGMLEIAVSEESNVNEGRIWERKLRIVVFNPWKGRPYAVLVTLKRRRSDSSIVETLR